MPLLRLLYRYQRTAVVVALLLSLVSSGATIVTLILINQRMHAASGGQAGQLAFVGLLLFAFVVGTAGQVAMSALGHRIVYRLRRTLAKQVLDTSVGQLEEVGLPRVLACLSSDVNALTLAFASLPTLLHGLLLALGAFVYLAWLSLPLFGISLATLALAAAFGVWMIIRMRHETRRARDLEDRLSDHYAVMVEGRKELALNRHRAKDIYENEFERDARRCKEYEMRIDIYNAIGQNWIGIILLAAIGLVPFQGGKWDWATMEVITAFVLTLMFLRAPITRLLSILPHFIGGSIALRRIEALQLAPYNEHFTVSSPHLSGEWKRLRLDGISYRYRENAGEPGFVLGPIDLEVRRGEILFIVGGNGSGKTTLLRLLCGLTRPNGGRLCLDGMEIDQQRIPMWHGLFSTVFSDFQLFKRVLGAEDGLIEDSFGNALLKRLGLAHKVVIEDGLLSELRLSQGQRKRLALLLAWAEQRPVLLLDEWGADQDPAFRDFFYKRLLPELRAAGKTIIAVTHDENYFHLADRVLKLHDGRLSAVAQEPTTLGLSPAGEPEAWHSDYDVAIEALGKISSTKRRFSKTSASDAHS